MNNEPSSGNHDIILDTKLVGAIKGQFSIPSYQRGYRWGAREVTRLLDDIHQNGKKKYWLQPVVVRRSKDEYELIDGQQRLTTIYLIYKYMNEKNPFFGEPAFSLTYKTRDASGEFLKKIDLSKRCDNIDFYFIANAYEAIEKWFEEDLQIRAMHIFEYFKEDVKIIWYEVDESEDATALFTRLNIGKIPLTSAELVKAMFLSRDSSPDMDREKQEEISLQWDNIEKALHNDSLWYFLTNKTAYRYQTRIDLVLDLISGKQENTREDHYSFYEFEKMRHVMSLEDIWRRIQQTFLILKDWFEDHELYHKIGYLIASDTCTLQKLFDLSKNKTKSEFRAELNELIKGSIDIRDANYSELSYAKAGDYRRISTLLLLFNVESVRQNGEHTQWFPFDRFKFNGGGKAAWSLEHIHAQQSEGMRTQEMWKEWLRLHIPSVRSVSNGKEGLLKEMQEAVDKPRLDRIEFDDICQRVTELLSVRGSAEYLHSIANLALLNTGANAALNNSTFDVKRNMVIDMDKKGQFIPFCTKMVFLKYYTPSADNQLHFWGQADRIAYVEAINTVLAEYLAEPIIIEKGES